ncbi:lambda-crystallin-like [Symsagittifera roscoffensis]|uniref:lambda-crystallin-like n=1 Tax=Symsagittifera roscoffensis TaxID=84072 RepID=UPI00307BCA16
MAVQEISIVGSGAIGQSLGIIFAVHGIKVTFFDALFEADSSNISKVKNAIVDRLNASEFPKNADKLFEKISFAQSLSECVKNADLVYECVFENPEIKQKVMQDIDKYISTDTIMASSTSCIMPSVLSAGLKHQENFIVAHPVNPPFYLQLVEIVPAPWTKDYAVQKVKELMLFVGQKPICLKKEADGFALNRVQYAVINSSWNLVKDGILDPEDVDSVMVYGLGPRYAAIGPFQTAQTNAPGGFKDYMQRYEAGMLRVSKDAGFEIEYDKKSFEEISSYLEHKMPVANMAESIQKRDSVLKQIKKMKQE